MLHAFKPYPEPTKPRVGFAMSTGPRHARLVPLNTKTTSRNKTRPISQVCFTLSPPQQVASQP